MNREILFRGQRVDNNEWVYGYYFIDLENKKTYIHLSERKNTPEDWMVKSLEVIPETVGQFTGLTDKNGVKIFEGDILKRQHWNNKLVEYGGFMFNPFHYGDYNNATYLPNYCEVIGNIHQNPELL